MKKWYSFRLIVLTLSFVQSSSLQAVCEIETVRGPLTPQTDAPPGEVIEALFISQNKLKEVLEYIQSLKKALTECSVEHTKETHKKNSLADYHCQLKKMLFPAHIKELEGMAAQVAAAIDELAKEGPIKQDLVKSVVNRAFLLKDKVHAEENIVSLILKIDQQESQRRRLHKNALLNDKAKLKKYRTSLITINDELYKALGSDEDRTFLHQLRAFKEAS